MVQMQACTTQYYEVTTKDLPLSCPMREWRVWDAHPRVYLPIAVTGEAICPYCGTHYRLTDYSPEGLSGGDVEGS